MPNGFVKTLLFAFACAGFAAITAPDASATSRTKLHAACEAGKLYDCVELGTAWENGDRGPQDLAEALRLYRDGGAGRAAEGGVD